MVEDKKRFIAFDDSIDQDSVSELCNKIDDAKGNCAVYFSSEGGEMVWSSMMCDKFNQYHETLDIVMIYKAESCGFDPILYCKNKITLGPLFSWATVHLGDIHLPQKTKQQHHKILKKDIDRICKIDMSRMKRLLSKKDFKNYKKGKDIYLDRDQVQKAIDLKLHNT